MMMTEIVSLCQSCGMPLQKTDDYGTEADGSNSRIFCHYCYQNGVFTEPDISIEEMAGKGAAIMSEMFGIPPEKASGFVLQQLQPLKRWSGRIIPVCESCGMPLMSETDCGTEADKTASMRYCTHCYQNGAFTDPDLTREEMIQKYAPLMAAELGIPLPKAEEMVTIFSSTLPRWQ